MLLTMVFDLDHVELCYYLMAMECLTFISSYICDLMAIVLNILTHSSHAHIEGELKANRNIYLFCTFALMIVNAKIIYCIYDTTCMVVINKQKGGD